METTSITKIEISPIREIYLQPLNIGYNIDYLNNAGDYTPQEKANAAYRAALANIDCSSLIKP